MSQETGVSEIQRSAGEHRPSFLIVDDEMGWRDLLSYELAPKGYAVALANNATEGLARLQQQAFDVIITDVRMPGPMDGIDLINAYRQQKPAQKVIFITGYAKDEKLIKALEPKHSRCLKKPMDIEQLFHEIEDLLQEEG